MYVVSERERDFSGFNFEGLKFMVFVLFQVDWLLLSNLRETEDKVQSTVHWKKNQLPQLAVMQNRLSTETVHH